ncbi:septum formation initiator family protein [uncultured Sunxiuqinia sp.]|uniref:FtsB family cell division protein n=1 Tax=uncultured Sunxiuqinia sp. TaxID=1573825 RepID=UPI002AA70C11|nr:septum formation initiator family protein [uncultured Sunxiuqinia sp.]
MNKMIAIVWSKLRTKYGIVLAIFVLWVGFFDEHSLLQHFQNKRKLARYTEQEAYLKNKIVSDKRKIHELQTNQTNLEKFAREEFLMKKENEDVYVVVEED